MGSDVFIKIKNKIEPANIYLINYSCMKKINFLVGMALFAMIGFSSCKDEVVVSSPVSVDKVPRVTITGYVTAEMNLQSLGAEPAPVGTKLFVEVTYADISGVGTTKGKWSDSVRVAADGKFSIAVPANAGGVTVTITPFPFEADQTQAYGAFYPTIKKSYTFAGVSTTVTTAKSGQIRYIEIPYSDANLPVFKDLVKISGKAQANMNDEIVGLENIPNGTSILFSNALGTWNDSVLIQDGKYSINVPKGVAVYWKIKFTAPKRVWVPNTTDPSLSAYSSISYEYSVTGTSTYSSNTVDVNLSAGIGTDLTVDPNAEVVILSGAAVAELDLTNSVKDPIPDGKIIYFYTNTWGAQAVISGGKYSVKIPKGQLVSYSLDFNANRKPAVGASTPYRYVKTGTVYFTTSTATTDIDAGNGTLIL